MKSKAVTLHKKKQFMQEQLLTFQKFKDEEIANDLCEKLFDAEIYFEKESEDKFFDVSFATNSIRNNVNIKIKPSDFNRANAVLNAYYKEQISQLDKNYYLFEFTDSELKEIISKPDEWGKLDYQLAISLLNERGIAISSTELERLTEIRKEILATPEKSQHWLVLAGYFIAAASPFWSDLVRFSGLFLAVMIGWILMYTKKTLPNGDTVFMYSESDRMQGKILIFFSVLIFVSLLIYIYFKD